MNNARLYLYGFCSFMCGCCFGWVMLTIYAPDPLPANDCYTYKISEQVVTSYALKPPPAQVVHEACPQVVKKIEEEKKIEEPVEEPSRAEEDRPRRKRRHHRNRRIRAYWR